MLTPAIILKIRRPYQLPIRRRLGGAGEGRPAAIDRSAAIELPCTRHVSSSAEPARRPSSPPGDAREGIALEQMAASEPIPATEAREASPRREVIYRHTNVV